jgi:hypothetical protein
LEVLDSGSPNWSWLPAWRQTDLGRSMSIIRVLIWWYLMFIYSLCDWRVYFAPCLHQHKILDPFLDLERLIWVACDDLRKPKRCTANLGASAESAGWGSSL